MSDTYGTKDHGNFSHGPIEGLIHEKVDPNPHAPAHVDGDGRPVTLKDFQTQVIEAEEARRGK